MWPLRTHLPPVQHHPSSAQRHVYINPTLYFNPCAPCHTANLLGPKIVRPCKAGQTMWMWGKGAGLLWRQRGQHPATALAKSHTVPVALAVPRDHHRVAILQVAPLAAVCQLQRAGAVPADADRTGGGGGAAAKGRADGWERRQHERRRCQQRDAQAPVLAAGFLQASGCAGTISPTIAATHPRCLQQAASA